MNCRLIANPLLRAFARVFRHLVWMRHPLDQGLQLDRFLARSGRWIFAWPTAIIPATPARLGVGDPASFQSAQECLGKLRAKLGERARFTIGDHDLGKLAFFGGKGGMRLASWLCATQQLGLQPFWKLSIGRYILMGVASPLIALPANQPDTLPDEWPAWQRLREAHLAEIRAAFDASSRSSASCCSVTTPRRCRFCGARNPCAAGCRRWSRPSSAICTRN